MNFTEITSAGHEEGFVLLDSLSEVEQKETLYSAISDMSKDATGHRVRFDYMSYTVEQLKKEFIYWEGQVIESIDRDRREQATAQKYWDAIISKMMSVAKCSRAKAIKWDFEAHDCMDADQYCYEYGMSYRLAPIIEKYLREARV